MFSALTKCSTLVIYLILFMRDAAAKVQYDKNLTPRGQADSLNFQDEEFIHHDQATNTLESGLVIKHDDSCYEGNRLPDHTIPRHYSLVIEPNLEKFTFRGAVAIDIDTDTRKLSNLRRAADDGRVDFNLSMRGDGEKKKDDIDTDEVKLKYIQDNQIVLHIDGIDLHSAWFLNEMNETVTIQDACVSPKFQVAVFNLESSLTTSSGKLYIRFKGKIRDDMKGLYRSRYTAANGETKYHATTQFQATYARRAFPCFDEPNLKASFDIILIVPKGLHALSNMHVVSEEGTPNKKVVKFATSPPMSTYLVAFVIGEFSFIEGKSRGRTLRVYTPLSKNRSGRFALDAALKSLTFLEDYFDIEFPLKKMDLVAIPDFHAGAMENWGLITFRETNLLIDEENSSLITKTTVAQSVAHELAHQWFGNLVTMSWWDDLWLNEGFATYMEYFVVDKLFKEYSMMTKFINERHTVALFDDASQSTHPIQASVDDPIEIDEIFDNISYNKGASIVRILHDYLTEDVFRASLQNYLSENSYNNTATVDLWNSFELISGKPIREMMHTWTDQAGYPCLEVSVVNSNDTTTELSISQKRFYTDGIDSGKDENNHSWIVPISIITGNKPNSVAFNTILSSKATKIVVRNERKWIKLNSNFSGFYCVNYSKQLRYSLYSAIKSKQLPILDRMNLVHDIHILTLADEVSAEELLTMLTYYVDEDDGAVWELIVDSYMYMATVMETSNHLDRYKEEYGQRLFENVYNLYGWNMSINEPYYTTISRSSILFTCLINNYKPAIKEALKRFDLHVAGRQPADPSIRNAIYYAAVEYGGDERFDKLFELYAETDLREEQNVIANALAKVQRRDKVIKVVKWMNSDAVRDSEQEEYLLMLHASKAGRTFVWDMIDEDFDNFLRKFGPQGLSRIVHALGSNFRGDSIILAKKINGFFSKHDFEDAERTRDDIMSAVQMNAKLTKRYSIVIEQFLKSIWGHDFLTHNKKQTNDYKSDAPSFDENRNITQPIVSV